MRLQSDCYCGAEPIFVDLKETRNLDPELLERALKNEHSVKAVICVHLYGQCAQMDPILSLCEAYGVPLIEDAAEAWERATGVVRQDQWGIFLLIQQ